MKSRLLPAVLGLMALIAVSVHAPDLPAASHGTPHSRAAVTLHVTSTGCHHYGASGSSHAPCGAPLAILASVEVAALSVEPQGSLRPDDAWRLTGRSATRRHRPPILPA